MRSLFIISFLLCLLSIQALSQDVASSGQGGLRLLEPEKKPPKDKPPPSDAGSGTDGDGGGSGTGGSGGGSDGSGGTGGDSGSGGNGGDGTGGSSSGTNSDGSGGNNGDSSSGGSSSGGTTSKITDENGANTNGPNDKKKAGVMGLIGGAVVVGAVAVAAALRKKQPKTVAEHALKGSLAKRMKLFGRLAEHNDAAVRPPRRYEPEDVYTLAPEPASAYV